MGRPIVNPGTLVWSGEHWIDYVREPGADADSGMVSLYRTVYSPSGEGITAFVDIGGEDGLTGICTDNPDVADFLRRTMIQRRPDHPFNRELPMLEADLARGGDTRTSPSWTIRTGDRTIVAGWDDLEGPFVTEGPAGTFTEEHDFFTIVFFARRASIELDGRRVPGEPYVTTIWDRSIGGERSSCVFALAETMTLVR